MAPTRDELGFIGKIFSKMHFKAANDPAAAHLLTTYRSDDANSMPPSPSTLPKRHEKCMTGKQLKGKSSADQAETFTIRAIHGSRPNSSKPVSTAITQQSFVQKNLTPSQQKPHKYDIALIQRDLDRMSKLQLGPLTIRSDIPCVLELWDRLQSARMACGRRAIVDVWTRLSHATVIVSRKMTLDNISAVLEAHLIIITPCPSGLRLPRELFCALASRADGGGQLAAASDAQLYRFCYLAGSLLKAVALMDAHFNVSRDGFQFCIKKLQRIGLILPFIRASLSDIVRRVTGLSRCNKSEQSVEERKSKTAGTLLLTEALAELTGPRLLLPQASIDVALATAADEKDLTRSDKVLMQKKVVQHSKNSIALLYELSQVIDSSIRTHTKDIMRMAGDAASILLEGLLPLTLPHMGPQELQKLNKALLFATDNDEGLSTHEPLRQALGCVLAEVLGRDTVAQDACMVEFSCLRSVIKACRKRLLHITFTLSSPSIGIAEALARLEARRSQLRQAAGLEQRKAARKSVSSNEAVSLELSLAVEDGDEVLSRP